MTTRRTTPTYSQEAASNPGGGWLSGFLLPPLAVIIVGGLLVMLVFSPLSVPVSAVVPPEVGSTLAPVAGSSISPIFTAEVQYWSDQIVKWAAAAGIDPNLAATVMQLESCGDPFAKSGAGAMGLFQVMPYHFAKGEDPFSPDTNALRGMDYLRRSLAAANRNARLALAGYNGGIGVIGEPFSNWAGETQRYSTWGSGIYQDAVDGVATSAHLQNWLTTSGASMCRTAHARLGITP